MVRGIVHAPWVSVFATGTNWIIGLHKGGVRCQRIFAFTMYIANALLRASQLNPQGRATVFEDRHYTWQEVMHRTASLAGALTKMGCLPGDRVAILSKNSDRYIEVLHGISWAGCVVVPLNFRWTVPELRHALEDSGSRVIIFSEAYDEVVKELPTQPLQPITGIRIRQGEMRSSDSLDYEDLLLESTAIEATPVDPESMFGIFYTGGTTGRSKGVMLSTRGLWSNVMLLTSAFSLGRDTRFLHLAPSFHLADFIWCLAVSSSMGTHAFLEDFDPAEVADCIACEGISHTGMVPTMLKMMLDYLDNKAANLSSLKYVSYGAAPMPEVVLRKALEVIPHVDFIQAFGQTELSPIATILPAEVHRPGSRIADKLTSVGRAIFGTRVEVMDPEGFILAPGQVGEVAVSGPGNMLGYWNNPQQTSDTIRNGWIHTGDAGYLDEDRYLFLVDRIKDMIVSGGENVYSVEVENMVLTHPAVSSCAVIGMPDDTWGERVHAVIVPRPGETLTQEELYNFCKQNIASYKCPRSMSLTSELPISAAGKIQKNLLREIYA